MRGKPFANQSSIKHKLLSTSLVTFDLSPTHLAHDGTHSRFLEYRLTLPLTHLSRMSTTGLLQRVGDQMPRMLLLSGGISGRIILSFSPILLSLYMSRYKARPRVRVCGGCGLCSTLALVIRVTHGSTICGDRLIYIFLGGVGKGWGCWW